jgi:hypothetical protein
MTNVLKSRAVPNSIPNCYFQYSRHYNPLKRTAYQIITIYTSKMPVTLAVRSEAWVLAGWLLGSWVRILLKAWMFIPCLSVVLSRVGRGLATG